MSYIRAWAYEADVHCNGCKNERFGDDDYAVDGEGNPIHPIFQWDELNDPYCGDCLEEIE